jgi:hypothetical protein
VGADGYEDTVKAERIETATTTAMAERVSKATGMA